MEGKLYEYELGIIMINFLVRQRFDFRYVFGQFLGDSVKDSIFDGYSIQLFIIVMFLLLSLLMRLLILGNNYMKCIKVSAGYRFCKYLLVRDVSFSLFQERFVFMN